MASLHSHKLEIEVFWSAHQSWATGQTRGFLPLHNVIFWIIEQGEATLEMNGSSYLVREGEAVLQPANQERFITARTEFRWLSVGFRAYWFGGQDIFHSFDTPSFWVPKAENREFLTGCLNEIVAEVPNHSIGSQLRVEGAMRSILGHCFENCPIPQSTSEFPSWLENALQILRDEPNIELNDLAVRIIPLGELRTNWALPPRLILCAPSKPKPEPRAPNFASTVGFDPKDERSWSFFGVAGTLLSQ